MSRIIKKGATDQTIYVEILDSASTTGGRKTGIVYNSAGLTAYYVRNGGSATAITLATLAAANSAHADGGFIAVDGTNMPGVYRLDLPDAVVATGAESVVVTVRGASGAAQVSTEIQLRDNTEADVYSRVGAPAGASIAADIATVDDFLDTEVAAIKAKTDNLPASPAAVADIPTANANADALLDRAAGVETGWTVRQAMRIMLSALAGKASGLATTTAVFRDVGDTKARITATVDADGNRSAITLDAA